MGKAYITPQKDGRFIVQVKIGVKNGKPIRKSKSFRSEEEALAKQAEWNEEYAYLREQGVAYAPVRASAPVKKKISDPTSSMSLVDYLVMYYSSNIMTCKEQTLRGYFDTIRLIGKMLTQLKYVGLKICEVDLSIVMEILQKIADNGLSQSQIDKARNVMKRVIKQACFDDHIAGKDFTHLISVVKTKKPSIPREPYTDAEISMLSNLAREQEKILYTAITVFESTGMRPEELRALEWSNLDWNRKTIRITNAIVSGYKNIKKDGKGTRYEFKSVTKSKSGVRTLPLSDIAVHVLSEWRLEMDKRPKTKNSPYIFANSSGDFIKEHDLGSRWDRFLQRNSLNGQGYIFYRYRHTFCTRLALADVSLKKAMALMGDSSTSVVLGIYSHVKAEDVGDEVRDIINRKPIKKQPEQPETLTG